MTDDFTTLQDLDGIDGFERRHIGPDEQEIATMLSVLGLESLEDLHDKAVPKVIRTDRPLALPEALSEAEALEALRAMAARNTAKTSLIGMGYHGTITPSVIQRNVLENPAWYTAYTPYQAEVSQGRLEALLIFQQMVCDLTGMELANASLLDEATAAAEAMAMARRVSKVKSDRFVVDSDCHPQTIAVLQTRARGMGIEIAIGDANALVDEAPCFGVLVQYPGSSGAVRDIAPISSAASKTGALSVVASDLLSLTLLRAPGQFGADIVVGSAQRFGVPMGYGGPHAAFFATKSDHRRAMPGRIIGVSKDASGKPAYRMALQTREQHIRRDKATSNICTAQVLLAMISAFYAVYHGGEGLKRIALRVHRLTSVLAQGLRGMDLEIVHASFFDTIAVRVPGGALALRDRLDAAGYHVRVVDADHIGISLDETTRRADILALFAAFGGPDAARQDLDALDRVAGNGLPLDFRRVDSYLTHPVFSENRSETEMMRFLRRLADKDLALDQAMIPLGSCTMKLNAATEMMPVSFPGFSAPHPFVPREHAQGYADLIESLESMLAEITGFDAISMQPNAGSQGEYAGLLTIRRYHDSRGEGHRDVCLIPSSAHGTNPASAVMAGLRVVVVACDADGNVDVPDLESKIAAHGHNLAALMVTYPSTHGVFEEAIVEVCRLVHDVGGQVYMDGANLNALVGVCRPAEIGADVAHMNLHKTFCIPHGGGGPGMGPIGVRDHLAPFLPDHPVVEGVNNAAHDQGTVGTVSAAPWGSPSILPISWAYIAMMGGEGLRRATLIAILSANYIAARLHQHYPVLYRGRNDMVAHECIIDLRPIKESTGITVEDVAKRLVDYGFHAPTMSFPVPDTIMIEPTESESLSEINRFCEAMISIRQEIADIERGAADRENNLLRNAPHTPEMALAGPWDLPYGTEQAFYPTHSVRAHKFWPQVRRVDNVWGDRNLMCACPPISDYQEAAE